MWSESPSPAFRVHKPEPIAFLPVLVRDIAACSVRAGTRPVRTSAKRSDRRQERQELGRAAAALPLAQVGDLPTHRLCLLDWGSEPRSLYRRPLQRLVPLHRLDGSLFEMTDCRA